MLDTQSRTRNELGIRGEAIALEYLEGRGYTITERNFRCRRGEIDLIAEHEEYIVFVEVKSRRRGKKLISPYISMTKAKCSRIRYLGKYYLETNDIRRKQPRFDVIGIVFEDNGDYSLEHIKNAF